MTLQTSLIRYQTSITYWTNPRGSSILSTQQDLVDSTDQCLPLILDIAEQYDGFLLACYADHPLTDLLRGKVEKPVTGIFESSITTALQLVGSGSQFAILTTVKAFEKNLTDGVFRFLESKQAASMSASFAGVVATGITAEDLTDEKKAVARSKVVDATRLLIRNTDVKVICMGGAILSGMEFWVQEACALELGIEKAGHVRVIHQMLAGVTTVVAMMQEVQGKGRSQAFRKGLSS